MRAAISLLLSFRPRSRLEIAGLVALMLGITATYVGQGLLIARLLSDVFAIHDFSLSWCGDPAVGHCE